MKNFKILSVGFIVLFSSVTSMAFEGSGSLNPITWTEINGIRWSSVLQGNYKNLDLDGTKPLNGIIQKSEASEACVAIGGTLPTKEDFSTLNGDYKKLPGISKRWFWLSSVALDNPDDGYFFIGTNMGFQTGVYHDGYGRESEYSVLCVAKNLSLLTRASY